MSTCEYNPETKSPACDPPLPGDCKNEATTVLGAKGHWHVCNLCASLPEFRKFRSRMPVGGSRRDAVEV